MGRSKPQVEQLVVIVSGACTSKATAELQLGPLMGGLQAGPERLVLDPIAPAHFGLHHLDRVQDKFADKLHSETDKYPDAKVIVVGHSLGGLLARSQDVHGLVTIGTPHEGTRWYVPGIFRRQYEAFSQHLPSRNIGSIALIGSFSDEWVPPASALARSRTDLDGQRFAAPPYLTHNFLPLSRSVKDLTARLVDDIFAAGADSLTDMAASA